MGTARVATLCCIRRNLYFSLRADGPYNYEFATRVCLGRRTRECQKVKYLSQGDELNHVNRTLRAHMHPHTNAYSLPARVVASNDFPRQLASAWNFALQTPADIFRGAEIACKVLERGVLSCHWKFTIFALSI